MSRLERHANGNAVVSRGRLEEKISHSFSRARQKTGTSAEIAVKNSRTGKPSTGEVILRSVRPEIEQGTVWELAAVGIENALDVTCGKKEFPQAVTCIGNRALRCGASGATVNSAVAFAAETLVLAGYNGAARLIPIIGQGVIAFLLINSIAPVLPTHADGKAEPATKPAGTFVPATY